ncbi:hypothetical protein PRRG_00038 [Prochlorococcus phage P-RSP2]|jgi:hypothetical protein|nr:hypothetical protein PRRG_00038 [Prochlorococcus phage P-RSP2]
MMYLPESFNPFHRVVPEDSPFYDNPNDLKFQGPEQHFFRRLFRGVVRAATNVLTLGASRRAEKKAKRATQEAVAEANRARDEYNRVASEINTNIANRQAQAKAEKAKQDKLVGESTAKRQAAETNLKNVTESGKRNVAYATKLRESTISKLQQEKQAKAAADIKRAQSVKKTGANAPGIGTTVVKGPGDVGGTGKAGSARGKTKGVKDKAGKLLIG